MWNLLLVVIMSALSSVPAQTAQDDLETVLQRATKYVTKYEEDLGNLIGSEEYIQNASWKGMGGRGLIARKMQRRTSSDFLILQVGPEWSGLRKVNRVDGSKVKDEQQPLADAFDGSPQSNYKQLRRMIEESTQYNIGDVIREINLPTFALAVMRKAEVQRFKFEKAGVDKIDGVQTWEVRFHEVDRPTLVHGEKLEPLYSSGTLWIDPDTGRILKTELVVENRLNKSPIKARVIVTYEPGKRVPMLVPNLMLEHYETEANTIDCRADYSNFRAFEVDVKFEIAPPKPF
jgi:hypothetical protein